VAEWLRSGLQSRLQEFDSPRRLLNPFDVVVAIALGAMGIALAVVLASDGGSAIEVALVLVLFGAVVLRWVAHALSWQRIWRR
jgi:hypothetical protein